MEEYCYVNMYICIVDRHCIYIYLYYVFIYTNTDDHNLYKSLNIINFFSDLYA